MINTFKIVKDGECIRKVSCREEGIEDQLNDGESYTTGDVPMRVSTHRKTNPKNGLRIIRDILEKEGIDVSKLTKYLEGKK